VQTLYVNEREHPFQSLGLIFGVFASYLVITHWKGEPDNKDARLAQPI
jgi:hypothetical protein